MSSHSKRLTLGDRVYLRRSHTEYCRHRERCYRSKIHSDQRGIKQSETNSKLVVKMQASTKSARTTYLKSIFQHGRTSTRCHQDWSARNQVQRWIHPGYPVQACRTVACKLLARLPTSAIIASIAFKVSRTHWHSEGLAHIVTNLRDNIIRNSGIRTKSNTSLQMRLLTS